MWSSLFIPDDILKSVSELGFEEPTPIQQQVLPLAIRDHADILGSAPTGSGKTLAFGIPLICRVRDAKAQNTSKVAVDLAPVPEELKPPPVSSKKAKKRKVPAEDALMDPQSAKVERKRRKVLDALGLIEELDPETMGVVKVHDVAKIFDRDDAPKEKNRKKESEIAPGAVLGLVILPTRELALQVTNHLRALAKHLDPPGISIEAIVGGISIQKQERLLRQRQPDIVVATPGRLWEFIQQENVHMVTMPQSLVAVVFDEADRLVESQHFVELGSILRFLKKKKPEGLKRQTFVFSATLTFVHANALIPGTQSKKALKKLAPGKKMDTNAKLIFLRDMLGLSSRAKVVDLSSSTTTPHIINQVQETPADPKLPQKAGLLLPTGLSEYRLVCQDQVDKDVYLVWLLLAVRSTNQGRGRALVFLNSKSGARRLAGVLRQCDEIAPNLCLMHADMVQKQRLRSLERFQANESAVILATDVAARGLDFAAASVAWVIHFDVPRTTEIYIHRSGRTARANKVGRSVVLIAPGDIMMWRKLAKNLTHLPTHNGIPDLPELTPTATTEEVTCFRSIVRLMREMDEVSHSASKKDADLDWFRRTAKEADIDLGSDFVDSSDDDEDGGPRRKRAKKNAAKTVNSLKQQLNALIHAWRCEKDRKKKYPKSALGGKGMCIIREHDLQ